MSDDATRSSSAPRVPTADDFPASGTNALATFAQRAWARVIDTMLLYLPLALLAVITVVDLDHPDKEIDRPVWFAFAWVIVAATYEVIGISVWGRTLGKLALGTRVARFIDGGTPTWEQAFLRCLLPLAAGVVVLVAFGFDLLGAALVYTSVLSSPLGRGWHDRAGGTVVIRTR